MKKLVSIVLVSLAAPLLRAEFSAGFARLDITPPLGLPMPGHFHKRIADGVLDPLCVECIAVLDGTNDALIYSVDDLQLPGPFFEKAFPAITAATGVPRDRIYVHSTHTHTGVSSMLEKRLRRRINPSSPIPNCASLNSPMPGVPRSPTARRRRSPSARPNAKAFPSSGAIA